MRRPAIFSLSIACGAALLGLVVVIALRSNGPVRPRAPVDARGQVAKAGEPGSSGSNMGSETTGGDPERVAAGSSSAGQEPPVGGAAGVDNRADPLDEGVVRGVVAREESVRAGNPERFAEDVRRLLVSSSGSEQFAGICLAGEVGEEGAKQVLVPEVERFLHHDSAIFRARAVQTMGAMLRGTAVVLALRSCQADQDAMVRAEAIAAMVGGDHDLVGGDWDGVIIAALDDEDPSVRARVVSELEGKVLSHAIRERLLDLAGNSGDLRLRKSIIRNCFGAGAEKSGTEVGSILKLLEGKQREMAYAASLSLQGGVPSACDRSVAEAAVARFEKETDLREQVAGLIGRYGGDVERSWIDSWLGRSGVSESSRSALKEALGAIESRLGHPK